MNRFAIIFRASKGCDRSNMVGTREGEVQSEEKKKSWGGAAIGSSGELQGRISKGLEAAKLDRSVSFEPLCFMSLFPFTIFLSCLIILFL